MKLIVSKDSELVEDSTAVDKKVSTLTELRVQMDKIEQLTLIVSRIILR